MGYRSRRDATRLRAAAACERLREAEQAARDRLGGSLPYGLETRLARLEALLPGGEAMPLSASRPDARADLGLEGLLSSIDELRAELESVRPGARRDETLDEAFAGFVRDTFRWRPRGAAKRLRAEELSAMLRRLDPDAAIGARAGGASLEARLFVHRSPLFFVGQIGAEVAGMLATPIPRQAGSVQIRPYRWWRRLRGLEPATLGHGDLDGRFAIVGTGMRWLSDAPANAADPTGDWREALAALCRFDEPTLHIEGAAATLRWTYDVAYEPLSAAARVLACLRRLLSPRPPAPGAEPPSPRARMLPAVPARLRQRRR